MPQEHFFNYKLSWDVALQKCIYIIKLSILCQLSNIININPDTCDNLIDTSCLLPS